MITLGLRLRDVGRRRFTWRDLWVIVQNLPVTSALARAIDPDAELATPEVQLLAYSADMAAMNFWAQTEDASKGRNRPKPAIEALIGSRGQPVPDSMNDPNVIAAMEEFFSRPRVAA